MQENFIPYFHFKKNVTVFFSYIHIDKKNKIFNQKIIGSLKLKRTVSKFAIFSWDCLSI